MFIEPKNGLYAFDIVPGFWKWIEDKAEEGIVRSPMEVFDELVKLEGDEDELARWAKRVKEVLFVVSDSVIQEQYREVADYILENHEQPYAAQFLSGADPWLIAHAIVDEGIVVTIEKKRNTKAVKIPNICEFFEVEWINLNQLLRNLEASFVDGSKKKGG